MTSSLRHRRRLSSTRLPRSSLHNKNDGCEQSTGSCPSSPAIKKAYRMVIAGSARVGKSALIERFLHGTFTERYLPTIESFQRKTYRIRGGELHQLDILDLSGNDPFPAARRLSLLSGDLFMLVSSCDRASSIVQMLDIRDQIVAIKQRPLDELAIVMVMNKSDLLNSKVELSSEDAMARVAPSTIQFCSAAENSNVNETFGYLFTMARLPKQMNPMYKMLRNELSADAALADGKHTILRRMRSKFSRETVDDECCIDPTPRRPSLRTDLLLNQTVKKTVSTTVRRSRSKSTPRICRLS